MKALPSGVKLLCTHVEGNGLPFSQYRFYLTAYSHHLDLSAVMGDNGLYKEPWYAAYLPEVGAWVVVAAAGERAEFVEIEE